MQGPDHGREETSRVVGRRAARALAGGAAPPARRKPGPARTLGLRTAMPAARASRLARLRRRKQMTERRLRGTAGACGRCRSTRRCPKAAPRGPSREPGGSRCGATRLRDRPRADGDRPPSAHALRHRHCGPIAVPAGAGRLVLLSSRPRGAGSASWRRRSKPPVPRRARPAFTPSRTSRMVSAGRRRGQSAIARRAQIPVHNPWRRPQFFHSLSTSGGGPDAAVGRR